MRADTALVTLALLSVAAAAPLSNEPRGTHLQARAAEPNFLDNLKQWGENTKAKVEGIKHDPVAETVKPIVEGTKAKSEEIKATWETAKEKLEKEGLVGFFRALLSGLKTKVGPTPTESTPNPPAVRRDEGTQEDNDDDHDDGDDEDGDGNDGGVEAEDNADEDGDAVDDDVDDDGVEAEDNADEDDADDNYDDEDNDKDESSHENLD